MGEKLNQVKTNSNKSLPYSPRIKTKPNLIPIIIHHGQAPELIPSWTKHWKSLRTLQNL
eukprot:UN00031